MREGPKIECIPMSKATLSLQYVVCTYMQSCIHISHKEISREESEYFVASHHHIPFFTKHYFVNGKSNKLNSLKNGQRQNAEEIKLICLIKSLNF